MNKTLLLLLIFASAASNANAHGNVHHTNMASSSFYRNSGAPSLPPRTTYSGSESHPRFSYPPYNPHVYGNDQESTNEFFWGSVPGKPIHFDPVPDAILSPSDIEKTRLHYSMNAHWPAAPRLSVEQSMSNIDERLLNLAGQGRLGTCDVDFLSSEMLEIKRDYLAATSQGRRLSTRREFSFRKQLAQISHELDLHR